MTDIQGSTFDQESHLGMKGRIADEHLSGTFARVVREQQNSLTWSTSSLTV